MTTELGWMKHVEDWRDCQRCPLAKQRDRICLGRGDMPCDVVFLGEAPGMSEDTEGLPFVGPAGDLLDSIIAAALEPWQVPGTTGPAYNEVRCAFNNLVACYPRQAKSRGDNEPERGEVLECRPRLVEFVNLCQPRLIVLVGDLAQRYARLAGPVQYLDMLHPAYILSRMVPAQKPSAINKCVVTLRRAVETVLAAPQREWQYWGPRHGEATTSKQALRDEYDSAEQYRPDFRAHYGEDDTDIPF